MDRSDILLAKPGGDNPLTDSFSYSQRFCQTARVWEDAAVHGRRTQRSWSSPCSIPFERISRDECGGSSRLRNDTEQRDSKRCRRPDADARAAVRRSELPLLRRQVGSTVYQKTKEFEFMSDAKPIISSGGIRGQSAGSTAICTVGKEGIGLTYRGYNIEALGANATFEEVAYLLLKGALPNRQELNIFQKRLKRLRYLPTALREVLERIPEDTQPMDVLRTGTSMLGTLEPEHDCLHQNAIAERLLASLPSMLCYWYRFAHHGKRIEPETDEDTLAGHLLTLINGEKPSADHQR